MLMIPVSPGELVDKLTILEIKLERMEDAGKRERVRIEHTALQQVAAAHLADTPGLGPLREALREVNGLLWEIEDDIRDCERAQCFDAHFIELARAVYRTNDRRAEVKRAINELLASPLREEKSYATY